MKLNFWPFNRNRDNDSTLPAEVKDYYQAEKRERTSVASLLALGTLIVTVVLALGLFYGGRWVYRAAFNNDKDQAPAVVERQDQSTDGEAGSVAGDQAPAQGTVDAPQNPSPTSTSTPTSTQTPSTSGPLPRTGPDTDL